MTSTTTTSVEKEILGKKEEEEEQKQKNDDEKLPEDLEKDIDQTQLAIEKKKQAIDNTSLKEILKLSDEREIIKKIRELPVLTQEDHKQLDQLDTSKFRLWMMRESQKDEFLIMTKKVKETTKDGEVIYEVDERGTPIIDKLLVFYSPITNHQKKTLRRLESVATQSAIAFNQKNIEVVTLQAQKKTDNQEYWNALAEREKLQDIYNQNNEVAAKKNAEFRLGIKPTEYDHILEQDLLRFIAVALYKESLKNRE